MKKLILIAMSASSIALAKTEVPFPGPYVSDTTTVIHESGRIEQTYSPQIPDGKKAVVVNPGRVENGTEWGRHIEFRDKTLDDHAQDFTDEHPILTVMIVIGLQLLEQLLK